jgi:hypothetical protein
VGRLDAFANARKPITRSTYCGCPIQYCGLNSLLIDGTTVRIFDNFIQIGYTIIPRFPKVQEYYVFEKPEVTRVIITIKNMF